MPLRRYTEHAVEIIRAIENKTKEGAVAGENAAELSSINDAVGHLITLLASLDDCYESGDDVSLPRLISTLAPRLDVIAKSQDCLLQVCRSPIRV